MSEFCPQLTQHRCCNVKYYFAFGLTDALKCYKYLSSLVIGLVLADLSRGQSHTYDYKAYGEAMNVADSIVLATNAVKSAMERNEIAKKSSRLVAFTLSLLPIPVVQQSSAMLDRYFSDKDMNEKFEKIWDELSSINPLIREVADMGAAIQEIAKTIKAHNAFNAKIESLAESLSSISDGQFTVETSDFSIQEIVDSIITTKTAEITADNFSKNIIHNVTVSAKNTKLKASNNSSNRISHANFNGSNGSVTLNRTDANGTITLEGSSIGFEAGSSLDFGVAKMGMSGDNFCISIRSPAPLQLTCPTCHHIFKIPHQEASTRFSLTCPNCGITHLMPKAP